MLEPGIYEVSSKEEFLNNYYDDVCDVVNGKVKLNYYNRKKNKYVDYEGLSKVIEDYDDINSLEFFVSNKKGAGEYKMLIYIKFGDDNDDL